MKIIKNFLKKYQHLWILSYCPVYLAWFHSLEMQPGTKGSFHILHTAFDDIIPFCEYFIIPYFLWFAYVFFAAVFFARNNKDDFFRLCAFLFSGMTISLLICSIFPNGTDLRPVLTGRNNIFATAVSFLYQIDTCTNVFPSIHVYNSIGVHIAISKSRDIKNRKHGSEIRLFSLLLAILICMSTVFLKQHSILDVCGAIIMAYVMHEIVYPTPASYGNRQSERMRKKFWLYG